MQRADGKHFGIRLREARLAAGLSQSELEELSGIPKARLSRYLQNSPIRSARSKSGSIRTWRSSARGAFIVVREDPGRVSRGPRLSDQSNAVVCAVQLAWPVIAPVPGIAGRPLVLVGPEQPAHVPGPVARGPRAATATPGEGSSDPHDPSVAAGMTLSKARRGLGGRSHRQRQGRDGRHGCDDSLHPGPPPTDVARAVGSGYYMGGSRQDRRNARLASRRWAPSLWWTLPQAPVCGACCGVESLESTER